MSTPLDGGGFQVRRAVAAMRTLVGRLEALQVGNTRAQGWSWQQIGEALGVSRQAVHKKHGRS